MNLSELIHRPSEVTQPVVTSTYGSFQHTTTDAMHLGSIYHDSDVIDSRLAGSSRGASDASLYGPSKLLPMTSSWHYSTDCGGDGSGSSAVASRSPNASTLSDQSAATESFQPKRMTFGDSPSLEGAYSSTSSSNRTLVENSPASPVPLDSFGAAEVKNTAGLYQRRRTSVTLSTSESIGSSYNNSISNHLSPESTATRRSGELPVAIGAEPPIIVAYHYHQQRSRSVSNSHGSRTGSKAAKGLSVAELTICGDNVTKETLEEGYIQFVLHHDPMYVGDSLENHIYVRRKFSSVPKTGDLSYTTWDVYTLVKKLHNHQIKNWSQLVGQLGLSDVPGRPQFAQRVKRWMRKYRIDSYFDYLLGNPYKFHTEPGEKYSGCLVMGNYQKRKANNTEADVRSADDELGISAGNASSTSASSKRRRRHYDPSHYDEEDGEDEDSDHTDDEHGGAGAARRTPIVHAGSRKRRSHIPAAKTPQEEEDNEDLDAYNLSTPPEIQEEDVSMYPREYLREDEEDELASTSSSISLTSYMSGTTTTNTQPEQQQQQDSSTNHTTNPTSSPNLIELPVLPPASQDDSSFNTHAFAKTTAGPSSDTPNSPPTLCRPPPLILSSSLPPPLHHSSPTHAPPSPSISSCDNCARLQDTVNTMHDDVMQLKQQLLTLEEKLRQETESKAKVSLRLESLCNHYEKWRMRLAEQLLDNPFSGDNEQV